MRALLVGLVVGLSLFASLAAAQGPVFTFNIDSQPVVEQALPDLAVRHDGPATMGSANAATDPVPIGPRARWTDQGLALREREAQGELFIPWLVNLGHDRMDGDSVYPSVGDVQYDLSDQTETTVFLLGLIVPGAPSTNVASGVPDLKLGFSLRDGVAGCVGACLPDEAQQLAASLPSEARFGRGFGVAHDMPLPQFRSSWLPDAFEGVPSERMQPLAEPAESTGLAAESAGLLGILPHVDATAAAIALAAGLLLLAAPIALYSKIRRDSTLENDTRRVIYESVVATPGLSIQDVARRASVSHSTAAYHLERLSSAGLVVATGDGNKVRYYRNGGRFTEQERKLLPILENVETVRVLETVLASPWTYRAEIAQKLGVTATTVNWHLKRLFGCAVLTERREGRNAYLFVERASLHVALTGLHEKLAPSPPRDVAAKLLTQLGPVQLPPGAAAPSLASLPAVPPPHQPSAVTVAGTVYPRLAKPMGTHMGLAPSE